MRTVGGTTKAESGLRKCSRCLFTKPLGDFQKNKRTPAGVDYVCRECKAIYTREWRRKHPEAALRQARNAWDKVIQRKYGANYNELFAHHAGRCAVCRKTSARASDSGRRFCIDHDHFTGVVRGLLCDSCNRFIGRIKDDPEVAKRLYKYLVNARRSEAPQGAPSEATG